MKLYKLYTHQKNFSSKFAQSMYGQPTCRKLNAHFLSAEDLVLNPKDHPDAKIGDVVEIYHPEDEGTRLLLQITCFNEDIKGTKGKLRPSIQSL